MENTERQQLLANVLDQTFGSGYAKKDQLLALAEQIRTLVDTADQKELLFLSGLLDAAAMTATDRYNKTKE